MQTQRGRSSYVTLNLTWLVVVCFLCFLAGWAFHGMQDGDGVMCEWCGETIHEDTVVCTDCVSKRLLGIPLSRDHESE